MHPHDLQMPSAIPYKIILVLFVAASCAGGNTRPHITGGTPVPQGGGLSDGSAQPVTAGGQGALDAARDLGSKIDGTPDITGGAFGTGGATNLPGTGGFAGNLFDAGRSAGMSSSGGARMGGSTGSALGGAGSLGDGAVGGGAATGGSRSGGATAATDGSVGGAGGAGSGGISAAGGASTCGSINMFPFGCRFAWGGPSSGTTSTPPSYWAFAKMWTGYEENSGLATWSATAINNRCDGCTFVKTLLNTNTIPILHIYIIGYQANLKGGFGDCNRDFDGHTLCTDGAQWIRDNRSILINAYAQYAAKVNLVSPSRPVVWWLEGDFFQYTYKSQSNPLSFQEIGTLARDIICAIKSNEPRAVVAMNHSPWISNDEANGFWDNQPLDVIDMAYVQASASGFSLCNDCSYNATTANYAWLHRKTGRTIMTTEEDGWSTASASTINQRITEGAIGTDVWTNPSGYQTRATALNPQLTPLPGCQ